MTKLNITIDSITWEQEGKYNYLKIILDKESGLEMFTTRILNKSYNGLMVTIFKISEL